MSLDLRELPGALFGSGAALRRTLTAWDAGIRSPVPTARRIGFISLAPGAGTSTLAAAVVRAIAARRSEPILAVDVSSGALGLGDRLGIPPTTPNDGRWAARTTADAVAGLAAGDGFLGLRPGASASAAAGTASGTVAAWLDEAAPITRFFDVSITDFGARHPLVDLADCAALCDTVCIVSDAGRSPAELARAVVPAIEGLPEAPTALLALVDHRRAGDAVARALGTTGRVGGVPFDRGLRVGRGPRRPAARRAVLRLAAALVSGEVVA